MLDIVTSLPVAGGPGSLEGSKRCAFEPEVAELSAFMEHCVKTGKGCWLAENRVLWEQRSSKPSKKAKS